MKLYYSPTFKKLRIKTVNEVELTFSACPSQRWCPFLRSYVSPTLLIAPPRSASSAGASSCPSSKHNNKLTIDSLHRKYEKLTVSLRIALVNSIKRRIRMTVEKHMYMGFSIPSHSTPVMVKLDTAYEDLSFW